jgi:hypothetical protein
MASCDVCGNEYDGAFTVRTASGEELTFDSFECAIHRCAPRCGDCGRTVIGHGVQAGGTVYCCASCAGRAGASGLADRA